MTAWDDAETEFYGRVIPAFLGQPANTQEATMPVTPPEDRPTRGTAAHYDGTTFWELRLSEDGTQLILSSEVDGEDYLHIPVSSCRTLEGAPLVPVTLVPRRVW